MRRAVVLNGAAAGDVFADAVASAAVLELAKAVPEVVCFRLREIDIKSCAGCFGCWVRSPGLCVIDDGERAVVEAFVRSDLAVFVTRVTFGGYSSELKKAVDRLIPVLSPFFMTIGGEVHHRPRYARYPSLAAAGIVSRDDAESARIFKELVARNALNFHSPRHAVAAVPEDPEGDAAMRGAIRALLAEASVRP